MQHQRRSPGPEFDSSGDDPRTWVDEHADALFRYAFSRVRDHATAEDLVQETFLAAVKSKASFAGGSKRRTWLIGILRHKVGDHFRKTSREVRSMDADEEVDALVGLFDERGNWLKPPRQWEFDPTDIAERAEFWVILRGCVDALPARAGEAFTLRTMADTEPEEVCKVLNISATNLWVLLHRARTRLRSCLEQHWFGRDSEAQ